MDLATLLLFTQQSGGSDLLVSAGAPLMVRVNGAMRRIADAEGVAEPLSEEAVRELVYALLTEDQRKVLETEKELDLAMTVGGEARFRANVFFQDRGLGAAFRVIPARVAGFDELGLPPVVAGLADLQDGLVLFTGPSGTGKSTSLAALIDRINATRRAHIVTIEEPIEFIHAPRLSMVNQRAVGPHTKTFANALRSALRESPDVIMVGELRDLETIALAITAAETGHLVLATLHTPSAAKTVDRIINVFPAPEQPQIRAMLADNLQAVVSQVLVPRTDRSGRALVAEVLVATTGVRAMIRDGKTHEIPTAIQTGRHYGMQSFEQALAHLVETRVLTKEAAARHRARLAASDHGEASRTPPAARTTGVPR